MSYVFNKQDENTPSSRRTFLGRMGAAVTVVCLPQLAFGNEAGKKTARRIVSVGGGLTEIMYALGAEKELVGVDTTSLLSASGDKVAQCGLCQSAFKRRYSGFKPDTGDRD